MASKDPTNAGTAGGTSESLDREPIAVREGTSDERSVSSRERLRGQLCADVEAFLARGGKIEQVEPHVTSDPPKKPDNNYGSRPI